MNTVFLSYCHDDSSEVSRMHAELSAAGFAVWWDQEIPAGGDWKYEIRSAMKRSAAVILCLSERCLRRAQSGIYPEAYEAIAAFRLRRPGEIYLIPIRLSECEIPAIEIDDTRTLDRLQYVDLFPVDRWDHGMQRIIQSLRRIAPSAGATSVGPQTRASPMPVTSVPPATVLPPPPPAQEMTTPAILDHRLHRFPRYGQAMDCRISESIRKVFAENFKLYEDARELIETAVHERREADPGDDTVTVVEIHRLPDITVGPYRFWYDGLLEAQRKGTRMIAALLMNVPDELFQGQARRDRDAMLHCLSKLPS